MRTKLLLVAALFCLLLTGRAQAQTVWTFSDINYPSAGDPTKICGIGYMEAEYSTQVYYWMYLSTSLTDTTNGAYEFMMRDNTCCGANYVWMDPTLPYDATHEYVTYMYPRVDPYFRREEDGALVDHYYLGTYLDGTPVLWPGSAGFYGFLGPGPETPTWSAILLGTLDSLFSEGQKHGTPDHVRVVSDNTSDNCGSKQRIIKFRIVDSQGRRVGSRSVEEQFFNVQNGIQIPFAWNSCRNENTSPSPCAPDDGDGTFRDRLWVGCPLASGDCGYSPLLSRWRWCPRDRPAVTLTTNTYDVRRDSVLINGVPKYNDGTHLY